MKGILVRLFLSAAFILGAAACTSAPEPTLEPSPVSTATAPEEETQPEPTREPSPIPTATIQEEESQPEPTEEEDGEAESASLGAELYQANCAGCHGPQRAGRSGPPLVPEELTRSRSYYYDIIENGSGPMPAWGDQFSEQEINALIDFINTPLE